MWTDIKYLCTYVITYGASCTLLLTEWDHVQMKLISMNTSLLCYYVIKFWLVTSFPLSIIVVFITVVWIPRAKKCCFTASRDHSIPKLFVVFSMFSPEIGAKLEMLFPLRWKHYTSRSVTNNSTCHSTSLWTWCWQDKSHPEQERNYFPEITQTGI